MPPTLMRELSHLKISTRTLVQSKGGRKLMSRLQTLQSCSQKPDAPPELAMAER